MFWTITWVEGMLSSPVWVNCIPWLFSTKAKFWKSLMSAFSSSSSLFLRVLSAGSSTFSITYQTKIRHHKNTYTSCSSLVVTRSYVCFQLEYAGLDWIRILLGSKFSGSASGVFDHAQFLTVGCPRGLTLTVLVTTIDTLRHFETG